MGRVAQIRFLAAVSGLAAALVMLPARADDTGFASIHDLANVGGKQCMTDHSHHGSGDARPTRKAAELSAIRSWADFTALEYGTDWSNYGVAIKKSVSCEPTAAGWQCSLDANPCRNGRAGYAAKRGSSAKAARGPGKSSANRTAAQ